MPKSVASLLAEDRSTRALRIALVAAVSLFASWVLDAFVDSVILGNGGFQGALLHPSRGETFARFLIAALVVLVYTGKRTSRRLHIMSSALAEAPDGIQLTELNGTIAYSNRAVQEIHGFSPEELLGMHVSAMNADLDFASRVILPEIARSGRWRGELDVRHKDGRTFPIWLTTSIVRDRSGKPMAALGIIRDLTERKRREEELRRYARQLEEATRLKDLFADILRHDLLGPVSAMHLSIGALLKRESDPVGARLLGNAQRSCARLTELIEGVARYARLAAPQDLEFGPLDLGATLRSVISDFEPQRAERGASIAFEPRGEYMARANPIVSEVFANLLSNALKYGPAGGAIAIDVHDAGDRWDVTVADSGAGIPDADKERVFTRFERLRKESVKGTGVGLAIARRIVDLHAGRIWVADNAGGGSVFHAALPKASGSGA